MFRYIRVVSKWKPACFVLLISVSLLLWLSCKKDPPASTPDPNPPVTDTTSKPPSKPDSTRFALGDKTIVIDTMLLVRLDANQLIYKSGNNTQKPVRGSILLGAPSQRSPYGFMRKVVSVSESATEITCTTEEASLPEAFKVLDINQTYDSSFLAPNGRVNNGPLMSIDFSGGKTLGNGITLKGVVQINLAGVKVEYKKSDTSLIPQRALIQVDLNTEGSSLELVNTNNSISQLEAIPLKSYDLPPIIIPIAGSPVPLVLKQKFDINTLPLSITSSFKVKINPIIRVTLGALYENRQWKNINKITIDALNFTNYCREDFPVSGDFSAIITLLNPRYTISPFGIEKLQGYFEVPNDVIFSVNLGTTDYKLDYNVNAKIGLSTYFWDAVKNNISLETHFPTVTLASGSWNFCALCEGYDFDEWWLKLDSTVRKAFNEYIGLPGYDMPKKTQTGLMKLLAARTLSLRGKGLKGNIIIPRCFQNLMELDLYNNELTSITVEGAPVLFNLVAEKNKLRSLVLNNLPGLLDLDIDYNELTSLNLTSVYSKIRYLSCNFNQLASLDMRHWMNLETVNCGGNQLTYLGISSDMAKLETIHCWQNKLGFTGLREVIQNKPPQQVWIDYGDCSSNGVSETNGPDPNNPRKGSDCERLWQ